MRKTTCALMGLVASFALATFQVARVDAGTVVVNDKFSSGYSGQADAAISYAVDADPYWVTNPTVTAYYIGTGPSSDTGTYWNYGDNVSNLASSFGSSLAGVNITNTYGGSYIGPNDQGTLRTNTINAMGTAMDSSDTFTITGLALNSAYSLYVIGAPFAYQNSYGSTTVTVTGGSADGNDNTMISNQNTSFVEGVNYVLFTGNTGPTGTVSGSFVDGAGDGVAGLQLVETVPEPASLSLLGFAGLGLLARRRKLSI